MYKLKLLAKIVLESELGKGAEEILQTLSYEFPEDNIKDALLYHEALTKGICRLVVIGDSNFKDKKLLFATLDYLVSYFKEIHRATILVFQKGCSLAKEYVITKGIPFKEFFPEDDDLESNTKMLKYGTHLVAFHNGKSAKVANLLCQAKGLDLEVKEVRYGK